MRCNLRWGAGGAHFADPSPKGATCARGLRERIIRRSPGRPSGWSQVGFQGARGSRGVPGNLLGGSWGLVWVGFGRMFAEGENRNMVRKLFISNQSGPKHYQIEEQDMAVQIFGVPGPGGAQKGRKLPFWGSRKIAFLAHFCRPHNYEYWEPL